MAMPRITRRQFTTGALSTTLGLVAPSLRAQNTDDKVFNMAVYTPAAKPVSDINGVVAHVMNKQGFRCEFPVVPAKRMPWSLRGGVIDTMQTSGLARKIRASDHSDEFILSELPVFSYVTYIYYKKSSRWQPEWPATAAMTDRATGVSLNLLYLQGAGHRLTQIPHYPAGAMMVNYDRADYWVDAFPPIPQVTKYMRMDDPEFVMKKYFDNPLHLLFSDSPRGRQLKELWDNEIDSIYRNGSELRDIFMHNNKSAYYIAAFEPFANYLRTTYPDYANLI